jgi:hypothetical protein
MINFIVKLLVELLAKPVVKRGLGVLFNRSLTPEEEEDFTEMVTKIILIVFELLLSA